MTFVTTASAGGAIKTAMITLLPGATSPTAQTTAPSTTSHPPWLAVTPCTPSSAGKALVTRTSFATNGPWFESVIENALLPIAITSGKSTLVITTSAIGAVAAISSVQPSNSIPEAVGWSSTIYNDHAPLGSILLRTDKPVVYGPAGAGSGN